MKKIYTLIGLVFMGSIIPSSKAGAQITVTDADMPMAGTSFATAYDTTSSVLKTLSPTAAGTNQTWNFGSLTTSYLTGDIIALPSKTPYAASFTTANLADSSVGTIGYNYISSTSSSFMVIGSEQQVKGVMVAGTLKPAMTELNFPAQFGNTDGGESVSTIPAVAFTGLGSSYDSAKGNIHIIYADTIDAWGSITTPYLGGTTYKSLRQKHYELDIDSVFLQATGGGWVNFAPANQTTKSFTYRWYTNGIGDLAATMTMDTADKVITSIAWFNGNTTGINEISQSHNTLVYPVPATNQVNFKYSAQNAQNIFVYDLTGRLLGQVEMKNNMATLNTSSFSSGIYFYHVTDKSGNVLDNGKFSVL